MEPVHVVLIAVGGVLLLGLIWFIGTYNALVRLRNHCDESWSDIDTELRRRYVLIPNLVETVKGYATHERDLLESVARARSAAEQNHGTPADQARDENALVGGLRQLLAVAEAYPELKADEHFAALQRQLAETEDRIQRSRRFYNANVRDLRNRIEAFPSNMVAGMFGFRPREFFEVDEAVRVAPAVVVA